MFKKFKTEIKFYSLYLSIALMGFLTLLDQITKISIVSNYFVDDSKVIIPKLLTFHLVYNEGASFGSLAGKMVLFLIITIFALAIFSYLITFSDYKKRIVFSLGTTFFLAGTLGNFIDRISYAKVIDFIEFPFLDFLNRLPKIGNFTCNLADIFLTVAIILLAIEYLILDTIRKKKEKSNIIKKDEDH